MAAISNQRASPKTAPAFRASQTSFQNYFEFRNGQLKMDFMLTEVTGNAKYTEVYFDEFQKHY